MAITLLELQRILDYDADTGIFTWKVDRGTGKIKTGTIAGSSYGKTGYLRVCIDYNNYPMHRLAWFYVNGSWPANDIDHINGIKTDNRLCNLREATESENSCNRGVSKNNKLGLKNISLARDNYYRVEIQKKGVIYYEYFNDLDQAIAWRDLKNKELHGDFAKI